MGDPSEIDPLESIYAILSQTQIDKMEIEAKKQSKIISNLDFLANAEYKAYRDGKDPSRLFEICEDIINKRKELLGFIPITKETREVRNNISIALRKVLKLYNIIRLAA